MDYEPIEAFLIGECGKTCRQAAMTTMEEYQYLMDAHIKRYQERWEMLRWQEWHQTILNPYIKKEKRPKTPKDMMIFPWETPDHQDIKKEDCYITKQQEDELNRIFAQINDKKNGKVR